MRDLKFREWLVIVAVAVFALWLGGVIRPAPDGLYVPEEAPTIWSAAEGTEYEYIGHEINELFEPLYKGAPTYAGHAQCGGLYVVCTKGQPVKPVDGSAIEAWCVSWVWDGTEWVLRELYLQGTQNEYLEWKAAQQPQPSTNYPE